MTDSKPSAVPSRGGFFLSWVLGDTIRTVKTRDGVERTVCELRDPDRLSQSLVLWLDGPAGALERVPLGARVQLHLPAVRAGRGRGEFVAQDVSRDAVEAAFAAASAGGNSK